MKVRLPVRAAMGKYPGKEGDYVLLKAACKKDNDLLFRLFQKKKEWEDRNGRDFFLTATLDLPYQRRTFRQNAAVWVLVTAIFESMDGRLPTEEEKYNLYLDLLEVYADRVPNRLNGQTRPIHISEANSLEGSRFIDALLQHLAADCDLSTDLQSTAQSVVCEWEAWRGGLEKDHTDYADMEGTRMLTGEEWRKTHSYSEASGRGGIIQRAHIVSRGSDAANIEASWNWLALTPDEHEAQHRRGWDEFLRIYPHLKGRVDRARRLAEKRELPAIKTPENLAKEALEV
jgi:hypothetical protein